MQSKSTLHPYHILPDKIVLDTKMETAEKISRGLGNTIPHNLRSYTVHFDSIKFFICPTNAHKLL